MKKVAYDRYYLEENYFGDPYAGLVAYFKVYRPKGKVLDLGCGQGRDSLFLAQLGYTVTGVDHSKVGIAQMLEIAKSQSLDLKGEVADVYTYEVNDTFDIVLLDSMLHFYSKDTPQETRLVTGILDGLKDEGVFVNLILKGDKRERTLKKIIQNHTSEWVTIHEAYVDYPEGQCKYHLLVVQKTKK